MVPRIAIAGLSCETSTFSPARTNAAAFHAYRGDEVFSRYPFINEGTTLGDAADWQCALTAYALPGGAVTRDAFETLSDEIIDRLTTICSTKPVDGLWYDIHGAMCVEGMLDVEAELLHRIRRVIGPDVIVSASMDLHGNVSCDLAHQTDLITCYRTAPHIDVRQTKERACQHLLDVLEQNTGRIPAALPFKAWIPIPILLAGEQTSTRMEPAKHIYAAVTEVEATKGILDAAVWVGYAWADEPRNHAVVVVTGWKEDAVVAGAEKLAQLFWDAHADFDFVAPTGSLEECLDQALASPSPSRPFFISDSGDNPTAGGSGDVTWSLIQVLGRPEFKEPSGPVVIYASIPGPQAVHAATEAGVGSIVTVTAGAEVDNIHSGPITMTGRVHSIRKGDRNAKVEVVLQVGSVFIILTELRKPYHLEQDFNDLSLQPRKADIVIVKIGYLEPELFEMAKGWLLALTPGGVDQDLVRLGHHRIHRPMWPFDKTFSEPPNLKARMIPFSYDPPPKDIGWT